MQKKLLRLVSAMKFATCSKKSMSNFMGHPRGTGKMDFLLSPLALEIAEIMKAYNANV